jgi:hypothetical protein
MLVGNIFMPDTEVNLRSGRGQRQCTAAMGLDESTGQAKDGSPLVFRGQENGAAMDHGMVPAASDVS